MTDSLFAGTGVVSLTGNPVFIENQLRIDAGNVFHIGGQNLDVSGGTLLNDGVFQLFGEETVLFGTHDNDSGTFRYVAGGAAGGAIIDFVGAGNDDYWNLEIDAAGETISAVSDLELGGSLSITSGTFNASTFTIRIAQKWINSGTFANGSSTIEFREPRAGDRDPGNEYVPQPEDCSGKDRRVPEWGYPDDRGRGYVHGHRNESVSRCDFDQASEYVYRRYRSSGCQRDQSRASNSTPSPETPAAIGPNEVYHPSVAYGGVYDPATQWRLTILVGANAAVDNLYVELSYSDTPMIPVSLSSHPNDWSFNWRTDVPVMSSWTYDSDGVRKIDEIRVQVQSSIPLDDSTPAAYSGLVITVDGYEVIGYTTEDLIDPFADGPFDGSVSIDSSRRSLTWIPASFRRGESLPTIRSRRRRDSTSMSSPTAIRLRSTRLLR